MWIHTVKHSLISVNVVLEILSKIGEFGLKKNNENSSCNHASCRDCMFYNNGSLVVLQKFLNQKIVFVRLCGHIVWCLYLQQK